MDACLAYPTLLTKTACQGSHQIIQDSDGMITTCNVLVKPSFQAQLLLCTFYLHEQCAWTSILLAPQRALYAMVTTIALNCQCHQKPCGPPGNQYPVETCTSMPSLLSLSSCDFTFPLSTCTANPKLFTLPQCSGKMACS